MMSRDAALSETVAVRSGPSSSESGSDVNVMEEDILNDPSSANVTDSEDERVQGPGEEDFSLTDPS